jgi:murein DD-endopeptidase MepM/ murein hydrolase activator NlpD
MTPIRILTVAVLFAAGLMGPARPGSAIEAPRLSARVWVQGRAPGPTTRIAPRASPVDFPPAYGSYGWPVVGPVIRGFEPPQNPYGAGHRGIDIATPIGTDVRASAAGVVAFAGSVAGSLFVSIDHPDGVRTTYSWLSAVRVRTGQTVAEGDVIALSGPGHPGAVVSHLHFGARVGNTYIDPMLLLRGADVSDLIHLAPL